MGGKAKWKNEMERTLFDHYPQMNSMLALERLAYVIHPYTLTERLDYE